MAIDIEDERQKMIGRLNELEAVLVPQVDAGERGAKKALEDLRALRTRIGG